MLPLHLIAIGVILVGTILLGIDRKQRHGAKTRPVPGDEHGAGSGNGDTASKLRRDGAGAGGSRSVGPRLKGVGKSVRLVNADLAMDPGDGASDDSRGEPNPTSRPNSQQAVDGNGEAKGGKSSQHKKGPGGEPSQGKAKKAKKEKA